MSTPPVVSSPFAPRDGDVVVTRELGIALRYTVRQFPGTAQVSTSSRDRAVRMARSFAHKHEIDVWYSEEHSYRLLEVYRFQ